MTRASCMQRSRVEVFPCESAWNLSRDFNPFTIKSDQVQISPAASPVILHHTVWRTWFSIAYSDEKWLYYQILIASLIHFSVDGWENVVFKWKGLFSLFFSRCEETPGSCREHRALRGGGEAAAGRHGQDADAPLARPGRHVWHVRVRLRLRECPRKLLEQ